LLTKKIAVIKRTLKIGFDAKRLFHNNTGLGNYARTMVKQLYESYPENEYHLFTPEISTNSYVTYFTEKNFFIHTKPKWLSSGLWRTAGMSKTINALNLDIFHGLSHEIPYFIKPETKTVVTMHDLIFEIKPHLFSSVDRILYKIKYRSSCQRADHIIAISNQTKTDLDIHYKVGHKTTCHYQSCSEIFQQQNSIGDAPKKHFLYVGTINERKGLLQIIKAYASLEPQFQIPFVVVGEGGEYKNKVIQEIHKNKLENHFTFKGNIENDELLKYYDECLCLLLPSIYEGFGIPVIESLFRKRPVITSYVSSLPEACGPGGLLIDPLNPTNIAVAMQKMFDETLWDRLSQLGHQYAINNFSKESSTQKLMSIYQQLIG
jgi:glycosyltransferase involved in cell wall biosynthesis